MPARRKLAAVPDTDEEVEAEPIGPAYSFEPMTPDLQSRLNVWGNATMLVITQIEREYPSWASALRDMLQLLKDVAESAQ